jgi:hypothetical protein
MSPKHLHIEFLCIQNLMDFNGCFLYFIHFLLHIKLFHFLFLIFQCFFCTIRLRYPSVVVAFTASLSDLSSLSTGGCSTAGFGGGGSSTAKLGAFIWETPQSYFYGK